MSSSSSIQQQEQLCVALHSLIDYVPLDKPLQFNQAQVAADRFNSVFYMHDANAADVMEICRLLSYYLRARFDVTFDRPPENHCEQSAQNLFYSLRDFNSYYNAFKQFLHRLYEQNQRMADNIEEFVNSSEQTFTEESLTILKQFREVRGIFSNFFTMFSSDRFDAGMLYERLFLERTCSAVVPLCIPTESLGSLGSMFDQLCYLCIQSVDYCNTVMPVVVSAGVVIYSVLYLCGCNDSRFVGTTGGRPASWGKVNSSTDEGMPQWLHAQIDTPAYQREIEQLPRELFDASAGDTYVRCHDYIATLIAQTFNRLFTRLIEWPVREDVAGWITEYLRCDNIFSFFSNHGRNEQLWIRLRKRRQDDRDRPSVYIQLDQLCSLYNEIAIATKPPQQTSTDNSTNSLLDCGSGNGGAIDGQVALPQNKSFVRDRINKLEHFKNSYIEFWLNGLRQTKTNQRFRTMFDIVRTQFILATGGYRGLDMAVHAEQHKHPLLFAICEPHDTHGLQFSENLSGVAYRGCKVCDDLLLPATARNMLSIERWLEQINHMIFPYNLLSLTMQSSSNYTPKILEDAIVFKMLEAFALRRLSTDRALKLLHFFREQRPICQFIVTQNDMVALWTKATNELAFFKEFLGV